MILSGNTILHHVDKGKIVIEPFSPDQVNPNSYNVRLAPELKIYNVEGEVYSTDEAVRVLDARNDNPTVDLVIPPEGLMLMPGTLYLGRTVEYTETPFHVPMLEGRSSLARLGVCVHITAGFGDRGFKGHFTLEITTIHPVRIYPNMEVAQICYYDVDQGGPVYRGKYNNKPGSQPGASQIYKDF